MANPTAPAPEPAVIDKPFHIQLDPETGEFVSLDVLVTLPGYEDPACTVKRQVQVSFTAQASPTAQAILDAAADSEGLSIEGRKLFALWVTNGVLDLQIRPRSTLAYIVTRWLRWVEKYTHESEAVQRPMQLEIRREALVTKAQERKVVEEGCLRFLFAEAKNRVVTGGYPCTPEDAATLCAYCLQACYGDYEPAKFLPGRPRDQVMRNIPPILHKAMLLVDWETKVLTEYGKLRGRSQLIMHMLYLQYVRQWPVYGSIFYAACKNVPPNGFFELRTDNKLIGVNAEGIVVVDQDKHKIIFSEPFTRMAWLYSEDTITLEYGPVTNPQSLTLLTPQAHLIDRLAVEAVRRIERQEKQVKKIRAEQEKDAQNVEADKT